MPLTFRTTRNLAALLAATLLAVLLPVPATAIDVPELSPEPRGVCEDVPVDPFADQQDIASVHLDAVHCMAAYEVVRGVGDRDGLPVFDPGSEVTRQQVASFLARFLAKAVTDTTNLDAVREVLLDPVETPDTATVTTDDGAQPLEQAEPQTAETPDTATATAFIDVDPDSPHADAIALLVELGIVSGVGDGPIFAPGEPLSRQQLASLLARTLDVLGIDAAGSTDPEDIGSPETSDPVAELGASQRLMDLDTAAEVHRPDIERLVDLGLVNGFVDDTFRPLDPVSRQQLASILSATAQYLQDIDRWAATHPGAPPSEPESPESSGTLTVLVQPEVVETPDTLTVDTLLAGPDGTPVEGALVQWALFGEDGVKVTASGHVDVESALAVDRRGARTDIAGCARFMPFAPAGATELLLWVSVEPTIDLREAVLARRILLHG